MSLKTVFMTPQVEYACFLHALTIEKEEIMGMLIGKFDNENNAYIVSTIAMQRSDKRKDRVEISDEQLVGAMTKASQLSEKLNDQLSVVGWYHSHPHITVEPSHVDLRTQANYQMMDQRFVGLIFSVFNEDKNMTQELQVTCFQSERGQKRPVPLVIERQRRVEAPCLEAVIQLPSIIAQEETDSYNKAKRHSRDILTNVYNDAKFVSAMSHIIKTTVNPLMLNLEQRIAIAELRCKQLRRKRTEAMQNSRDKRWSSNFSMMTELD